METIRVIKASALVFHIAEGISRALQNILSKFVYCRNRISCENFELKLCLQTFSVSCKAHSKKNVLGFLESEMKPRYLSLDM